MEASDEQLEMFSHEEDALFVENLTLTADKVLYKNVGEFENVLLIGIRPDGTAEYASNMGDVPFWLFWLQRCQMFMMRNCS
jgi:hypothetical protein